MFMTLTGLFSILLHLCRLGLWTIHKWENAVLVRCYYSQYVICQFFGEMVKTAKSSDNAEVPRIRAVPSLTCDLHILSSCPYHVLLPYLPTLSSYLLPSVSLSLSS